MATKSVEPANPFILEDGVELKPDTDVQINSRHSKDKIRYKIVRRLPSEASHSFSYEAERIKNGKKTGEKVFIKTPLVIPGTSESDKTRLNTIRQTFQREYEKQERLKDIEDVSHYIGKGQHEITGAGKMSYDIPFLAQEFIDGRKLDTHYVDEELKSTGNPFTGIKDAVDWFRMAEALVTVIKRVHNRQIVHGDIGPRNILLVRKPGSGKDSQDVVWPCIVDFGQSFLVDQDSSRPGRQDNKVIPYRAPERDRIKSWQIPADIYSIGAVLYFLASGSPPPATAKQARTVEELKSVIHDGILTVNDSLLRQNEGIVKIIDKCLRNDPHERYFCAENILADLDTFKFKPPQGTPSHDQFKSLVKIIEDTFLTVAQKNQNKFFGDIVLKNLDILAKHSESMVRDHFEIYGDRDEIIDHLCRYLSTLRKGDEYLTVTQPSYWSKNNLGTNGRFFTMNKIMARRGVLIRRVFLLSDDDLKKDSKQWMTLCAHKAAIDELGAKAEQIDVTTNPYSDQKCGDRSFYTGFLKMPSDQRTDYFEKEDNHVALWKKTDGKMMSIVFSTKPLEMESEKLKNASFKKAVNKSVDLQIVKVRFWVSARLQKAYEDLKKLCAESKPLTDLFIGEKKSSGSSTKKPPKK